MVSSAFGGASPEVAPQMTTRPAGAQAVDRVGPRRRADGLHDRVDLVGQPGAGLERPVRPDLHRPRTLGLVARGDPHPVPRRRAQLDQRRGHPAAGALDQDGPAGLHARVGEEHPVGRQPRRGEAGGRLPRHTLRLRHDVARRHDDLLGQRPVVELRQERPSRVEGLVAGPALTGDHRVDDDLVAVAVDAGAVAAEDHRQPVGGQPDALQRPDVVVVQPGRADRHRRPAGRRRGVGALADLQARSAGRSRRCGRRRRRASAHPR